MQQTDNDDNEMQNSKFTEAMALLFVTIVMLFLYIKILFY